MANNPFQLLNDYELRHLPHHLAELGHAEQLHNLLARDGPNGTNAWYDIKATKGNVPAFLDDVALAADVARRQILTTTEDGANLAGVPSAIPLRIN